MRINTDELLVEAETTKRKVLHLLRGNEFAGALQSIQNMFSTIEALSKSFVDGRDDLLNVLSGVLDETIQVFTNAAFSGPHRGSRSEERIRHGLGALQLQLSSAGILSPPYDSCPKATLTLALEAVSGVITSGAVDDKTRDVQLTYAAFRILQRLVTGTGVRHAAANGTSALSERDFNTILNALCKARKMDLAEKVVGLQNRTPGAPPLSAVSYSILLNGYGRLKDTRNVDMALLHAQSSGIQPDTILLNSAIDAYINCGEVYRARDIFDYMTDDDFDLSRVSQFKMLFSLESRPAANQRSYNTMLKGLARQGEVDSALDLAERMRNLKLWDGITTNTLVSAAVSSKDFHLAEELLLNYTVAVDNDRPQRNSHKKRRHPNVEAYTDLLDAYSKASRLDKAMATLKLMRQRGVEPNQHTYSCAIGALARAKKVTQANELLRFMRTIGARPTTVVYNSFISGLVAEDQSVEANPQKEVNFDRSINEAIAVLRSMLSANVRPNAVTVSVLVGALGRSQPPRVDEAKAIVKKLETEGFISGEDPKIATSLVWTFGQAGDFRGAVQAFGKIRTPDTVAINAFMEACYQCECEKTTFDTFEHFFGKGSTGKTQPDVVTYSILIRALLTQNSPLLLERIRRLYNEMKTKRRISPDKALVDM
jgi:pentatricopeptide repeat protein